MKTSPASDRFRPLKSHFAPSLHEWEAAFSDRDSTGDQNDDISSELTDRLIEDAIRERATDIHLDQEKNHLCVRFRVDGALHDAALLPAEVGGRLVGHIKVLAEIDPIPLTRPADGRISLTHEGTELNLRVACVPCIGGEKLSIRILETHRLQLSLTELGLKRADYETIDRWLRNVAGMFLVVGATGSGKTTTLYALLHELKMFNQSVVTIENPVEYRIDGITQMQVNDRRGMTFDEGVKAMLRLDPDFLLVGEVRDVASAHAALDVAASGKTVLSTLHSRDAAGAVTTLRNLHLKDYEIATALEVVVAQRLVRKLCPACRKEREPGDADKEWMKAAGVEIPETFWVAGECEECQHTGYRGRTGLFEVWHLDEHLRRLILNHADEAHLRAELRQAGVNAIMHDGMEKVNQGVTALSELQRPGL